MSHAAILVLLAVLSADGSGAAAAEESVPGQEGGSLIVILDGSGSISDVAGDGDTSTADSLRKANAHRTDDPADDEDDVDMGLGWTWLLGVLLVLAGLVAGLFVAIRRRRGNVDAGHGT